MKNRISAIKTTELSHKSAELLTKMIRKSGIKSAKIKQLSYILSYISSYLQIVTVK